MKMNIEVRVIFKDFLNLELIMGSVDVVLGYY